MISQFLAGQPVPLFKRSLEPGAQRLSELETEVRIADELPQTIIDQTAHQFLELLYRQRRKIHRGKNTEGRRGNAIRGGLTRRRCLFQLLDEPAQA